jgi:hypothetical protein
LAQLREAENAEQDVNAAAYQDVLRASEMIELGIDLEVKQ